MGYATDILDRISLQFVKRARNHPGTYLEVGAAFGLATRMALTKGSSNLIANDLAPEHLKSLIESTEPNLHPRLITKPGSFFDLSIQAGSLDGILCCRVLHFLTGPQLLQGLELFQTWLKPGGKLYLVVESPYMKPFEPYISVYEKRKSEGVLWPGEFYQTINNNGKLGSNLPEFFHVLDPEILERALYAFEMKIQHCDFFSRKAFPELYLDGKESVGLVAERS